MARKSHKKNKAKKNREIEYKKPVKEKIIDALDLPKDIVLDLPRMVLTGNRELYIENYRGIVEYTDTLIRLNTSANMIKVTGEGLNIKHIASEEITLSGKIKCMEFI